MTGSNVILAAESSSVNSEVASSLSDQKEGNCEIDISYSQKCELEKQLQEYEILENEIQEGPLVDWKNFDDEFQRNNQSNNVDSRTDFDFECSNFEYINNNDVLHQEYVIQPRKVAEIAGFCRNKVLDMHTYCKMSYGDVDSKLSKNGYKTISGLRKEGYRIFEFRYDDERARKSKDIKRAGLIFVRDREITIAYRGTKCDTDFFKTDIDIKIVPVLVPSFLQPFLSEIQDNNAGVHKGFHDAFENSRRDLEFILTLITKKYAIDHNGDYDLMNFKIYLTGHSMGGSIAKIAAFYLAKSKGIHDLHVATFGDPRVFSTSYSKLYNEILGKRTLRIVHNKDPVAAVIPGSIGFAHVGQLLQVRIVQFEECTLNNAGRYLTECLSNVHRIDVYRNAITCISEENFLQNNEVSGFWIVSKTCEHLGLGTAVQNLLAVSSSTVFPYIHNAGRRILDYYQGISEVQEYINTTQHDDVCVEDTSKTDSNAKLKNGSLITEPVIALHTAVEDINQNSDKQASVQDYGSLKSNQVAVFMKNVGNLGDKIQGSAYSEVVTSANDLSIEGASSIRNHEENNTIDYYKHGPHDESKPCRLLYSINGNSTETRQQELDNGRKTQQIGVCTEEVSDVHENADILEGMALQQDAHKPEGDSIFYKAMAYGAVATAVIPFAMPLLYSSLTTVTVSNITLAASSAISNLTTIFPSAMAPVTTSSISAVASTTEFTAVSDLSTYYILPNDTCSMIYGTIASSIVPAVQIGGGSIIQMLKESTFGISSIVSQVINTASLGIFATATLKKEETKLCQQLIMPSTLSVKTTEQVNKHPSPQQCDKGGVISTIAYWSFVISAVACSTVSVVQQGIFSITAIGAVLCATIAYVIGQIQTPKGNLSCCTLEQKKPTLNI